MITTKSIQFAFPWGMAKKALTAELVAAVEPRVEKNQFFSSIALPCDDPLVNQLLDEPRFFNDRSLIRLVRDEIRAENVDLELYDCFELIVAPDTDSEVRLTKDPGFFYELSLECQVCGRWRWTQIKDLEIRDRSVEGIAYTENFEIIVSDQVFRLIEEAGVSGVCARQVQGRSDVIQLVADAQLPLASPNDFLFEGDGCSCCCAPRVRAYENSNDVDLLRGPFDKPRVEGIALLRILGFQTDFAQTAVEFGTLANIPEGVERKTLSQPAYRTSWPKLAVASSFASLLLEACPGQIALVPCEGRRGLEAGETL